MSTTDMRGIPAARAIGAISEAVHRLDGGEVIEVLSSDPESVLDVLAWTHASENPLLDLRQVGPDYRFVIQRSRAH